MSDEPKKISIVLEPDDYELDRGFIVDIGTNRLYSYRTLLEFTGPLEKEILELKAKLDEMKAEYENDPPQPYDPALEFAMALGYVGEPDAILTKDAIELRERLSELVINDDIRKLRAELAITKAKLDGANMALLVCAESNDNLRAELAELKAKLDETTLEWHRLNKWCNEQSAELAQLKKEK